MPVQLKIKVDKPAIKRALYCGHDDRFVSESCAIVEAVREVFPRACVGGGWLAFDTHSNHHVKLPVAVNDFIILFDHTRPEHRLALPEIEFEITIPDSVIDTINIEEVTKQLENHPTLRLA